MTRTAIRLLRALVAEAINEKLSDDANEVVGSPVVVSGSAAAVAGIAPDRNYEVVVSTAVAQLVDEEALVYDYASSRLLANVDRVTDTYKIT